MSTALYASASLDGIDLDDPTSLTLVKAAVDNLYGTIFNTAGYAHDVQPNVDAANSTADIITAIESVFSEPTELYAESVMTDDEPGIMSGGGLYCGATDTKVHFWPGTTGLSEISAFRDCVSTALSMSFKPSLKSMVYGAMHDIVLPLDSKGNNYLVRDLANVKVVYTIVKEIRNPVLPVVSFYTAGDVTGTGYYNWQDIKGTQIEFYATLEGNTTFMAGDTITMMMSDNFDSVTNSTVEDAEFKTFVTDLYMEEDSGGGLFENHAACRSLTELKSLSPPVIGGGTLDSSEMAVFPIFVGNGDSSVQISGVSMLFDDVEYFFTSDNSPTSMPTRSSPLLDSLEVVNVSGVTVVFFATLVVLLVLAINLIWTGASVWKLSNSDSSGDREQRQRLLAGGGENNKLDARQRVKNSEEVEQGLTVSDPTGYLTL